MKIDLDLTKYWEYYENEDNLKIRLKELGLLEEYEKFLEKIKKEWKEEQEKEGSYKCDFKEWIEDSDWLEDFITDDMKIKIIKDDISRQDKIEFKLKEYLPKSLYGVSVDSI